MLQEDLFVLDMMNIPLWQATAELNAGVRERRVWLLHAVAWIESLPSLHETKDAPSPCVRAYRCHATKSSYTRTARESVSVSHDWGRSINESTLFQLRRFYHFLPPKYLTDFVAHADHSLSPWYNFLPWLFTGIYEWNPTIYSISWHINTGSDWCLNIKEGRSVPNHTMLAGNWISTTPFSRARIQEVVDSTFHLDNNGVFNYMEYVKLDPHESGHTEWHKIWQRIYMTRWLFSALGTL